MANVAKKDETKNWPKTTIEVAVDPRWIEWLTKDVDVFGRAHSGYWLKFIAKDNAHGHLAWEHEEQALNEQNAATAIEQWHRGFRSLPPRWFRVDRDLAIRAWAEGVKRGGLDWWANGDDSTADCALQMALLGELRYG